MTDTPSFTVVERDPAVRGRGTSDPRIAAMVEAIAAIGESNLGKKHYGLDGLLYTSEDKARTESQAVRKHLATALGVNASRVKTRVSPRGKGKDKRYTWEMRLRD